MSIAATAWPILLSSVAVGLAAFSVYWFVERPGIENLIGRWRGLDKEKVDMLCKSKVVDRETEKLHNLINELNEKISLHNAAKSQSLDLSEEVARLNSVNARYQSQVHDLSQEVARLNRELETIKRVPLKNPQLEPRIHEEQIEPVDIVVKQQDVINEQSKPSSHTQYSFFSGLKRTKSLEDLEVSQNVSDQTSSSHTKYSLWGELRRTKSMGDLDVGQNKNNLTHATQSSLSSYQP